MGGSTGAGQPAKRYLGALVDPPGGRGMNASARQATRQRIWVALGLVILAVYAVISINDASSAQARLDAARGDLGEMKQKLDEMQRLKQAPKVAALQLESPAEITNRVAAARRAADLPQASLLKEEPLDPQRIQRTDFEIRSTVIDLAPAELPKIIKFCEALRDQETGTVVRDMKLSEPQNGVDGGDQEKWEAALTLTQMIFSPKSR
jgi:type II secretory pathway pseudopilin PulG